MTDFMTGDATNHQLLNLLARGVFYEWYGLDPANTDIERERERKRERGVSG